MGIGNHFIIVSVARVKRILHIDEEINQCSANAAFAITVATVGDMELSCSQLV